MDRIGYIEIKVVGKKGNLEITPDNYDIKEIISVLQNAENLLFPNHKKERPLISYDIQEGSVKHRLKTALQVIIGFNAILFQIREAKYSIDFLEAATAKAFEFFQESAQKQGVAFEIATSIKGSTSLFVDQNTKFTRTEEIWADAEFYLYGTIQDAGGKSEANIHLDTKEYGLLKIITDKKVLGEYESNLLYKPYGIRAKGKQNIQTGEIDKSTLKLLEIIDYERGFNENYLANLIQKATASWEGVDDADKWLSQLR